jgi:hypothetical protein
MAIIPNGSAKKLLPYHITLILLKFKNLTVKDQPKVGAPVKTAHQP